MYGFIYHFISITRPQLTASRSEPRQPVSPPFNKFVPRRALLVPLRACPAHSHCSAVPTNTVYLGVNPLPSPGKSIFSGHGGPWFVVGIPLSMNLSVLAQICISTLVCVPCGHPSGALRIYKFKPFTRRNIPRKHFIIILGIFGAWAASATFHSVCFL